MKITHTLIQNFLENRCSADEAEEVARYLKKYPELMALYLRSSWDAAGKETELPPGYAAEMLQTIQAQVSRSKRVVRFRWMAAAASLLMLATAAMWLFRTAPKGGAQSLAAADNQPADAATWKQFANTTGKLHHIRLLDGSVIKMAPATVVRYREPFEQDKRDIYLDGEADFEVAHDTAKPFTVHSRQFTTTALGTSFKVSETTAGCNIRLFTGKVLIKAISKTLKGWKQDVILLPGNQMRYSFAKGETTVDRFHAAPKPETGPALNDGAKKDGETLAFDNTPLEEVIKALIVKYQTPIEFSEEQLNGKYFSGEVLKDDSLSVILKVIANMNELRITKKNNGYLISKSK